MSATRKLVTKTTSNAPGSAVRMTNARIGPSIAPIASIARCTPNAVPSFSFGTLSEISASRGAVRKPFPEPIDDEHASDPRPRRRRQQPEPRHRRARVSDPGDLLVASPAIGDDPARELHERGDTLIEPVDQPELNRAQSKKGDEVDRKDADDHLR